MYLIVSEICAVGKLCSAVLVIVNANVNKYLDIDSNAGVFVDRSVSADAVADTDRDVNRECRREYKLLMLVQLYSRCHDRLVISLA